MNISTNKFCGMSGVNCSNMSNYEVHSELKAYEEEYINTFNDEGSNLNITSILIIILSFGYCIGIVITVLSALRIIDLGN